MRNREMVAKAFRGATLEKNPSLTMEEHFIGNLELRAVNDRIDEVTRQIQTTRSEVEKEALNAQLDDLYRQSESKSRTLWKSNSNKGRELAFLKSQVPDSFDDAAITVKAERLSGGNLTNANRGKLIEIAKKGQAARKTAEDKMRSEAEKALERIRKMGGVDEVNLRDLEACV